jgi:hypothetical protein
MKIATTDTLDYYVVVVYPVSSLEIFAHPTSTHKMLFSHTKSDHSRKAMCLQLPTSMMNLFACTLGLLALSATGAYAKEGTKRPGRRPPSITTTIMDSSESVYASLYEPLTTTYTGDCYNAPNYDVATPCQQSCGGTTYSMSGSQYNKDARELTLSMDLYDSCSNQGVSFYVCAKVNVPPATWTRVDNTATVKAEATLADCGYYSEDSTTPPPNPLVGKKMAVDVVITCKKLSTYSNKCRSKSTGPEGYSRSRNYSYSEDCYVTNTGKLTVDGVQKTFESASFGTYRYKDTTRAPAPQAAAPMASG